MKDPYEQHLARMRELALKVATVKCVFLADQAEVERARKALLAADKERAVSQRKLAQAQAAMTALVQCETVTEDGFPGDREQQMLVREALGVSETWVA